MARRSFQNGCLFSRGKKWCIRWRETVLLPDNTTARRLRFETLGVIPKSQAKRILEERLRPINQGLHRPQSEMRFDHFAREEWEQKELARLKPSTKKYYGKLLRCHVNPWFGPRQLKDLTKKDVRDFLGKKRESGLSGSTVHGIRTVLSRVLQLGVDLDYLTHNPARGIVLGDRAPKREQKFLVPTQVLTLMSALSEPCRTIVHVAVLTGMRIGELLALRWKDVSFNQHKVSVRETVYEGQFGTPKTRSSRRELPVSEAVGEALLAHRERYVPTGPEDLVFPSRAGTALNSKNIMRRVLRPACTVLKLPPVTWHSFRHSHATLLGEVGESLKTAQSLLGHSDLNTTLNTYVHPIPESQRRAVDKVAELFANVHNSACVSEQKRYN